MINQQHNAVSRSLYLFLLAYIGTTVIDYTLASEPMLRSKHAECKPCHDKPKPHKPSSCHQEEKCHGKTKYVQGGLCKPGNGSKKHPWNSLALADADTSWNTLVVLASPVELVGGLNMRPGTSLVGEKSPVDGPTTGDQCIMSNPDPNDHDGNCVVVLGGDVCIKNIYFREINNSAISYNNARNLTVEHVLVTTYNKGNHTTPITARHFDASVSAHVNGGINGATVNSGKTKLHRVIVKDNYTGPGFYEQPWSGNVPNKKIKRKIRIDECEFADLTNSTPNSGLCDEIGLRNHVSAIFIIPFEQSVINVKIRKSFIHDFIRNPISSTRFSLPIYLNAYNSTMNSLIEDCTFYNLPIPKNVDGFIQCAQSNTAAPYDPLTGYPCCNGCTAECKTGPFVNPAPAPGLFPGLLFTILIQPTLEMDVEPGFVMNGQSVVRNNVFENTPEVFNANNASQAIFCHLMTTDSWSHTVENNIFKNYTFPVGSMEMGSNVNLKANIHNNNAHGGLGFMFLSSAHWANFNDPSTMVANYSVTNNNWIGGPQSSFGGIAIFSHLFVNYYVHSQFVCSPWANLTLNITDNCFDAGPAGGTAGIFATSLVPGCDAENATINASNNNFVGFRFSVFENGAGGTPLNINYYVANNFWNVPVAPFVPPALTLPGYTGTLVTTPGSQTAFPCPKFDICL